MSDVTRILGQLAQGDSAQTNELLRLVYDELRKLSAQKLAKEKPGQTLDTTALVHEAYLRLVDSSPIQHWESRGHFFAAAAEAMRRILIESARRKASQKRGGGMHRSPLDDIALTAHCDDDLLELDTALNDLNEVDPLAAELVKLRFFAGLSMDQVSDVLGISPRNAYYTWAYARSWLRCALQGD